MDRPINPPSDPLDPFIEEAEARWDRTLDLYVLGVTVFNGNRNLVHLLETLLDEGFSHKILEDAIIDQCDKLIQDLAERLYENAKDNSKGYD